MAKRLTAKDYRTELLALQLKQKALEARIRRRCVEMIEANPDVNMNVHGAKVTTRVYLCGFEYHRMDTVFQLMEAIEADLAAKHPHKQTAINF
jgi:hypothetical protein